MTCRTGRLSKTLDFPMQPLSLLSGALTKMGDAGCGIGERDGAGDGMNVSGRRNCVNNKRGARSSFEFGKPISFPTMIHGFELISICGCHN